MIVGALIAHGALGYFGYRWIRSQSAPVFPATDVNATTIATPGQYLPPVLRKQVAPKEPMTGMLHWSRRDGMSTKPGPQDNWKCAGGYYYLTTTGTNGSTVIELVKENNRPLRCKG
ncbi:MAG: hypothetical protein ABI127_03010 [Dokdonella sp.]